MNYLVLLRHGQSQWNLENRFTGWTDVDITELGEQEARHAGELLKANNFKFDFLFTSVLKRAIRTADISMESAGYEHIPLERDQALNERHYGDLQGLNKAETAKKYGDEQVHLWRRSYDVNPPNGESLKDTAARTIPYYIDKIEPMVKAGKNLWVVAHGNSLRSLVMYLDNLSKEEVLELNIPTGVPLVYEFENGKILKKYYLE
ncbi:MAG: 2,3-bisphosphoglycerate-dependent phosphoglycerate mutase [Ignavibacteriales bacterium]|jgi:phosphoglycerate mutase (EC 5.4.2.1)|nr:MAG: 2,3-bisphosphoglycerate-dependent phosphoglycerate mutase [Ignavibacteriaceae bacterium]MBW7872825.1 2,3-bisphosphoglycerate-dependent phosphoglycerate mutase [Ignavibacteria bacterium]MCZ2143544.1 2,3-bisphosphoglycerate-dependent phosphoglycerate mutase [Ignavibacteriales bacterium]MBV6444421.1 2,3-bisphosphoglycerate-dependent phosphoglycerate mutase [Ignavibacteriaceae bacterium]MBZ0197226.1 2,3-bisphosphoglycerate-dependent phosphoglycerate mutase [Ignavibacteriaceae bacterium]